MNHAEKEVRETVVMEEDDIESAAGCLQALQLTGLFMLPVMMNAAIELDVFGIIVRAGGAAGASAAEIASEILEEEMQPGTAARLDRMLGLLASHSLLTCSLRPVGRGDDGENGRLERIYGLTPSAKYFLRRDDQGKSLASLLPLAFHRATIGLWSRGKMMILDGDNQFEKLNGMSTFQYTSIDPTFNSLFNRGMTGLSTIVMDEVLNVYRGFEGLGSVVDVAGGTGKCIGMVVSKYPSIEGINFDQPHVIRGAPSYSGVKHVGGDMFESIPEGEAIMIKETLHNWNEERCIKLLKNCYKALPEKGKVIVINTVMPEAPDSSTASKFITQMDNCMMMMFESHERTLKQYEALSKASGFSEFRVAGKLAHSIWAVMEFCK